MDINKASEFFRKSKNEIRKCARQGFIPGAYKNFKWDIPDDIKVILSKKEITQILLSIIQFKTNTISTFSIAGMHKNNKKYQFIFQTLKSINLILYDDADYTNVNDLIEHTSLTLQSYDLILNNEQKKMSLFAIDKVSIFNFGLYK